jgi:hypothetical protein
LYFVGCLTVFAYRDKKVVGVFVRFRAPYYTICTFNVRNNHICWSTDSVTFTVKVPFANALYVSVPPAVIAVKAVCSEVNLPVPTAWFNKTACKVAAGAADTAATFGKPAAIKAASVHKL